MIHIKNCHKKNVTRRHANLYNNCHEHLKTKDVKQYPFKCVTHALWSLALLPCKCLIQTKIQFWDSEKNTQKKTFSKPSSFIMYFVTSYFLSNIFTYPRRRKETIINCARWKTVISANEIQWTRPLKRCSEQDNSVWLISDFDSEIFRKTSAPLFLQGEKAIRSVWAHLFLTLLFWITITSAGFSGRCFSLSFSFSVTVHFTHFDERFISISGMRAAMSVGVCRMFQHLDTVS